MTYVSSLPFYQRYACFDPMAEANIAIFRCKIALYLSCLHIKLDDEIKQNPFEFQAYFPIALHPKLNWRLGLALFAARFRSYWNF